MFDLEKIKAELLEFIGDEHAEDYDVWGILDNLIGNVENGNVEDEEGHELTLDDIQTLNDIMLSPEYLDELLEWYDISGRGRRLICYWHVFDEPTQYFEFITCESDPEAIRKEAMQEIRIRYEKLISNNAEIDGFWPDIDDPNKSNLIAENLKKQFC